MVTDQALAKTLHESLRQSTSPTKACKKNQGDSARHSLSRSPTRYCKFESSSNNSTETCKSEVVPDNEMQSESIRDSSTKTCESEQDPDNDVQSESIRQNSSQRRSQRPERSSTMAQEARTHAESRPSTKEAHGTREKEIAAKPDYANVCGHLKGLQGRTPQGRVVTVAELLHSEIVSVTHSGKRGTTRNLQRELRADTIVSKKRFSDGEFLHLFHAWLVYIGVVVGADVLYLHMCDANGVEMTEREKRCIGKERFPLTVEATIARGSPEQRQQRQACPHLKCPNKQLVLKFPQSIFQANPVGLDLSVDRSPPASKPQPVRKPAVVSRLVVPKHVDTKPQRPVCHSQKKETPVAKPISELEQIRESHKNFLQDMTDMVDRVKFGLLTVGSIVGTSLASRAPIGDTKHVISVLIVICFTYQSFRWVWNLASKTDKDGKTMDFFKFLGEYSTVLVVILGGITTAITCIVESVLHSDLALALHDQRFYVFAGIGISYTVVTLLLSLTFQWGRYTAKRMETSIEQLMDAEGNNKEISPSELIETLKKIHYKTYMIARVLCIAGLFAAFKVPRLVAQIFALRFGSFSTRAGYIFLIASGYFIEAMNAHGALQYVEEGWIIASSFTSVLGGFALLCGVYAMGMDQEEINWLRGCILFNTVCLIDVTCLLFKGRNKKNLPMHSRREDDPYAIV